MKKIRFKLINGLSNAMKEAENGNFGAYQQKINSLKLNLEKEFGAKGGYDMAFLRKSKIMLKELKKIV